MGDKRDTRELPVDLDAQLALIARRVSGRRFWSLGSLARKMAGYVYNPWCFDANGRKGVQRLVLSKLKDPIEQAKVGIVRVDKPSVMARVLGICTARVHTLPAPVETAAEPAVPDADEG